MAVEGVLVALDVGTSKVCALIGEIGRDGRLTVIGHGTVPSSGLKRGAVVNIEQTVRSIRDAVERAERLSGWKIDKAFVGVGGAQITSFNSKGQVSVAAHTKEVGRDDIELTEHDVERRKKARPRSGRIATKPPSARWSRPSRNAPRST